MNCHKLFSSFIIFTLLLSSLAAPPSVSAQFKAGSVESPVDPSDIPPVQNCIYKDIPAYADPWLAGMPNGSIASWLNPALLPDVAPYQSPIQSGLQITGGDILTFPYISGLIRHGPTQTWVGPDGNPTMLFPHMTGNYGGQAGAENGIANVWAPINSIIGIFLDSNIPNTTSVPGFLSFYWPVWRDFTILAPQLKQPFFIGDGKTSGGVLQQFIVPQGATRLFLGTMDGHEWNNNQGGAFGVPVCKPPTGAISGCVFVDTDQNGVKNGETDYAGSVDVRLNSLTATPTTPGCYEIKDIPYGTYTLRNYTQAPGYGPTFPKVGNQYTVTIGSGATCQINPTLNGQPICNNAIITNANFGISNAVPWIQIGGLNVRNDTGINNKIPLTAVCPKVMIQDGSTGIPGIAFAGDGSIEFGSGTASNRNWIVRGTQTTAKTPLSTSYESLLKTVTTNDEPILSLAEYCGSLSSCQITNTIDSGIYRVQGENLILQNVHVASKKVVIFAEKTVRITGTIRVNPGAFFMIVAKNDILVHKTVGANQNTFTCAGLSGVTPQLQGIFSAGKNFIINGSVGETCAEPDRQLNLAGVIITNAVGAAGGKLTNNRTLCGKNLEYPSVTIQPRLDFLMSMPDYLLNKHTVWQEVAP